VAILGGQLRAAAVRAGVSDARVLDALESVDRRRYLPPQALTGADRDTALGLPCGQTTSQPSLIALMLEALHLNPESKVLEVGTGFGYEAALIARLAGQVWTLERVPELADIARANLADQPHVRVRTADGAAGLPDEAPFDAIVVAARSDAVPRALLDQLAVGGLLVAPVGGADVQRCLVLQKQPDGSTPVVADLGAVAFVPLVEGPVRPGRPRA